MSDTVVSWPRSSGQLLAVLISQDTRHLCVYTLRTLKPISQKSFRSLLKKRNAKTIVQYVVPRDKNKGLPNTHTS